MRKRRMVLLVLLFLLVAASGRAQEKGQAGISMGYPASIGFVWHLSDTFALRPDFAVSGSSTENSPSGSKSDNRAFAVGIGAIFYTGKWENLRAYVSPRFSYSRTTGSSSSSTTLSTGQSVSTAGSNAANGYSANGLVGGQYSLSGRFSVFAEVGFGFTRNKTTATNTISAFGTSSNRATSNSWGTRAGVGAIIYF